LWKRKFYSAIHILGLSIGLASCLLIFLFVRDELSYDTFHKQSDDLYRLNWDFKWNNNEGIGSGTPPPLAAKLVSEIPEVESATRIYPVPDMIVRRDDQFFNETGIFAVDANFPDLFDFRILEGNVAEAFTQPNAVVLSESAAVRYFGDASPIGETLQIGVDEELWNGDHYQSTFRVTGIIEDAPANSHFQYDLLTSMASHPLVEHFDWSWVWMQVVTYAKLKPEVNLTAVEAKITTMTAKYAPAAFNRIGFSFEEIIEAGGRWNFVFQPLGEIYLHSSGIGNRLGPLGDIRQVRIFSIIAIFILLIACINFMNLSTAMSVARSREIGVRKVMGSRRGRIIGQFLTESTMYCLAALALSLAIIHIVVEPFNSLAGKELNLQGLFDPLSIVILLAGAIIVGLIAGSYPALVLSSFKPAAVLKGKLMPGMRNEMQRDFLVLFQFAISAGMIICTLVVSKQLGYVQEKNIGFDKEGVVVISNHNNRLGNQAETYRDRLSGLPNVIDASITDGIPPENAFQDYYKVEGRGDELFELTSYLVDDHFIPTMGITMLQGRPFDEQYGTNASSVILNETAVAQLGLEDPVGKKITYPGVGTFEITGIMKDFNFWSLREPILAFALFHESSGSYDIPSSFLAVKIQGGEVLEILQTLEGEWKQVAPNTPFEYSFLEEDLVRVYQSERRMSDLFTLFSLLAIFVACMGLLGLTTYAVAKRTKEIGIRRVLGASAVQIVYLFVRSHSKWVLLANLIAWPLAYFFMHKWLENFAFRTVISWDIFVAAGAITWILAMLTIGFQTLRGALIDPVDSLKQE
jgi:putative ABC transport system permease protein